MSEEERIYEIEPGELCDYETGAPIRPATAIETQASMGAARVDGGAGVIEVDGRRCYVQGGAYREINFVR